MQPNDTARFALQVAACTICLKTVDPSDCYRQNRSSGGLCHLFCIAVILTDDDEHTVSDAEMTDAVNDAAAEICSKLCENPDHPSTATACRHDGWVVREDYVIGCSPDRPEEWSFDHFHAIVDGSACGCRHDTATDARQAHGLPVEG